MSTPCHPVKRPQMRITEVGRNPVKNFFPDCWGDDYDSAVDFFRELFLQNNPNPGERDIYPHVTCAVDPNNIKVVDRSTDMNLFALGS